MTVVCKHHPGREARWTIGRLAGLCEECGAVASAAWHADPKKAGLARQIRCQWHDCDRVAKVRLSFGRVEGKLCPGVNYCDGHADQVRALFLVEHETKPTKIERTGLVKCGVIGRNGKPCERARAHGENTCPSHRQPDRIAA